MVENRNSSRAYPARGVERNVTKGDSESTRAMLQEMLELEAHNFGEFKRDYPVLHESLDKACEKLVETGFYLNDEVIAKTELPAFGSMLLTTHQWLASATLRFVMRDYDQGMSLLRMACEQARDLCVLVKEPLYFFLWKRYRTDRDGLEIEDQKKFRRLFRFDENSKHGAKSKEIYDYASEYGVHGSGIFSKLFKKLAPDESHKVLVHALNGLTYLPFLCRDSLGPFFTEHSALIERETGMPFEDFILDLDMRYAVISVNALRGFQEVARLR